MTLTIWRKALETMPTTDRIDELIHTVLRLNRMVGQRVRRWGLSFSTSQLQYVTLKYIDTKKTAAVGAIAKHMDVSRSSAAQLLGRMQRDGLISRAATSTDRRIVTVTITERGRRSLKQLERVRLTQLHRLFHGISAHELHVMKHVMTTMYRNITHHSP